MSDSDPSNDNQENWSSNLSDDFQGDWVNECFQNVFFGNNAPPDPPNFVPSNDGPIYVHPGLNNQTPFFTDEPPFPPNYVPNNDAPNNDGPNYVNPGLNNQSPFFTEELFDSVEHLKSWAQMKANPYYVLVISRSKKDHRHKVLNKIWLSCDRYGEHKPKSGTRSGGSRKCGCPFELFGKSDAPDGPWRLKVINDNHNHEPALCLEGHPYAERLTSEELEMVRDLHACNLKPSDILRVLKEHNPNNRSCHKTIYNAILKLRNQRRGDLSPMQFLFRILSEKKYIFRHRVNDKNEVQDIFFVQPLSIQMWRAFPDVLIMDSTYKTNKYGFPFLEIVGLTSTNMTFCIGFAFLYAETQEHFTWAMNGLRETLEAGMLPRVIVSDRDLALVNSLKEVFPTANRMLCTWHISNNIFKQCRPSFSNIRDWTTFMYMWHELIKSPTVEHYDIEKARLEKFLSKGRSHVMAYLERSWLQKYKSYFVCCYKNEKLNFGEHTSNRVEGQHAVLKRKLDHGVTMDKIVDVIGFIVHKQYNEIMRSFERSRSIRNSKHEHAIFEPVRGKVSHHALDLIALELQRIPILLDKRKLRNCHLRTGYGLPCACQLYGILGEAGAIQLDLIDSFWSKLDFTSVVNNVQEPVEEEVLSCESTLEEIREKFPSQTPPTKRDWLQNMKTMITPSKTNAKEPEVKKNTRGRPTTKTNKKPKMGLNTGPRQTPTTRRSLSFSTDLEETGLDFEPEASFTQPSAQHEYILKHVPDFMRRYVTGVCDVDGDGNCGFRAVAVCQGWAQREWPRVRMDMLYELLKNWKIYQEMWDEPENLDYQQRLDYRNEEAPAPRMHWMQMPDMGFLMANCYGQPVVFFSPDSEPLTIFPHIKGPGKVSSNEMIVLVFVHGNHFVALRLADQTPLPPIFSQWSGNAFPPAHQWEERFKDRLNEFIGMTPPGPAAKRQKKKNKKPPETISLD